MECGHAIAAFAEDRESRLGGDTLRCCGGAERECSSIGVADDAALLAPLRLLVLLEGRPGHVPEHAVSAAA